jgi:hypothetical protein
LSAFPFSTSKIAGTASFFPILPSAIAAKNRARGSASLSIFTSGSNAAATLASPRTFADWQRTSSSLSDSSGTTSFSAFASGALAAIWPRPQIACRRDRSPWPVRAAPESGPTEPAPLPASANCASCRTRMSACPSSFTRSPADFPPRPSPMSFFVSSTAALFAAFSSNTR